ncbi:ankyrin repeat protein [Fowlpox virus]|uniref:Putative ankyrin repeat protein FPV244 n=1 Tax=Fowlpox virus (strain NVSL) TaxID=928301 RepID=V244_FOWPN|nr:ankyrin repeat protein [Fowlpox virus]Q9J4Z6.1 RecName: Full=Putative ankyrin repeat protein FPV244 [Fowlpox virus strain NVSL]AAF44588.1 ORF FPV244 Ankyrin repeat gene family protein [Fowlpox virus]URH27851.1 ankyrin repeat protein [Fowlpox virus]URH28109.1 ankyrin repeat protein [Fowlpox virus]
MWPDDLYRIMCRGNYIEILSAITNYNLHKHGANQCENESIPFTAIHQALQLRQIDIVKELIQQNPKLIYVTDHRRNSTLHTICITPNVMDIVISLTVDCDIILDIKYASIILNKHKLGEACIHVLKEGISGNEISYNKINKSIEYMKLIKERIQQDELLIAEMLLKKGIDVNAKDVYCRTPIHYAAERGNTKMVNLLLSYGADVNIITLDDLSVLEYAVDSKNIDTIKAIIDNRSNINKNDLSLLKAIRNTDLETSLLLYDSGFSVNSIDVYKNTPLHYAVQAPSLSRLVPKLLERGIDVNAKNIKGETPLYLMAKNGYDTENIRTLIMRGADVNAADSLYITPLHQASTLDRYKDTVITLLELGANVNARDYCDKTPIHYAAVRNNVVIINTLLDYGADIEALSQKIGTVLHFALYGTNPYMSVKTLIDRGANVNSKNKYLSTPLHYACKKNCKPEVIKMLLDNGADVNAINIRNQYPLLIALEYHGIVNILLHYGAELRDSRVLHKSLNSNMFSFRYIIAHICIQDFIRHDIRSEVNPLREIIQSDDTFKSIWLSCKEELKDISKIRINMFYSLDIFVISKNMNLLHHLVNNPIIKEINTYYFYNYGDRLKTSISLASNRHKILEKSRSKLDEILDSSGWSKLPPDIKLSILEFIGNTELRKICNR